MPFHAGEIEVQRRAGSLDDAEAVGRGILPRITAGAARFLSNQRLAAAASVDGDGRVWASLLTGPFGFARAVDSELLRVATSPVPGDPLFGNLEKRPELGLVVIDPATRQRIRFNGRALVVEDAIFLRTAEVYGNCPKYIQKRRALPDVPASGVKPTTRRTLTDTQRGKIERADTLFIATLSPGGGADTSHRGGAPGFVAVQDSRTLVFPDYPGNGMFNSLGNLLQNPHAGLLFLDFENGDVLQLAGEASIEENRAVRFTIDEVRAATGASPLRYELVQLSPANPPIRASLSHDLERGI